MGRLLHAAARASAVFGGLVLFAMALLVATSVALRVTVGRPITGDFELVGIGTGVAVFAMLPWVQLTRGNVIVDFFTLRAPARVKAVLDAAGAALYLAVAAILAWRLVLGGIDMYQFGERSMTVGFPRWTTFPLAFVLLLFLVVAIAYTLYEFIREARK
ncbi:MAG TPA: TRAP transporter small permease [Burkholderiales bacterium]|nr:TRAP transporter small permease [Burkholderiales bacterium]